MISRNSPSSPGSVCNCSLIDNSAVGRLRNDGADSQTDKKEAGNHTNNNTVGAYGGNTEGNGDSEASVGDDITGVAANSAGTRLSCRYGASCYR